MKTAPKICLFPTHRQYCRLIIHLAAWVSASIIISFLYWRNELRRGFSERVVS